MSRECDESVYSSPLGHISAKIVRHHGTTTTTTDAQGSRLATNAHNGAFHQIRKLVVRATTQRFYQPRSLGLLAGEEKAKGPWEWE